MNAASRSLAAAFLRQTRLDHWPVRVRRGIAQGARWTIYPWTSYWRGTFEPALQAELSGLGAGDLCGWVCWDLGAHFGLYSVGLARRVGSTGEVAAFEPNPVSFARLAHHQRINRLPWLKMYCAAASDQSGRSEMLTYGDLYTTTTHLAFDGEVHPRPSHALPVRTVRLDDLVAAGELRPPQFVKIDVEGHGHRALAGMTNALRQTLPTLAVAFHSPEEIAGVLSVLTPLGYQFRAIPAAPDDCDVRVGADYLFTIRGRQG